MIKDDDKLIWRALTEQASPGFTEFRSDDKTHDPQGEEPGPMVALNRDEEEEGGCPNLDKLIGLAAALPQEEAEDNETDHYEAYLVDIFKQEYGGDPDQVENFIDDMRDTIMQKKDYDLKNQDDVVAQEIGKLVDMGLDFENAQGELADELALPQEDAEAKGVEDINITDQEKALMDTVNKTPL